MKTVILEGFLGDKYGREWSIVGNTYADIFGCISANYPEFRYDLINYYEAGGGLAILEGEKLLGS
jgi:predicted phage tail protein